MPIEKVTLGAAIKRVRIARGLTQVQLANASGLSKGGNSIALIEQGKRFVTVDTLNALANALDIPSACLAILGSRNLGQNKATTEFMESLQSLISTVVLAEEALKSEERPAAVKQASIVAERKHLAEIAVVFRGITKRKLSAGAKSPKKNISGAVKRPSKEKKAAAVT